MKTRQITTIIIVMLATACNKKEKGQFSTWYVNNDSFTTNEVIMSVERNGCSLSSPNKEKGFSLYKGGSGFGNPPQLGTYILSADYESGNPDLQHANFYYKGLFYRLLPDQADTLIIAKPAGKFRYTLKPGWFVNTVDSLDSVLIRGVFNES